jgi:hypothetical protein
MMRICDKRDALWLAALMLDAEIFAACSEDGVTKAKMATYAKQMLAAPDMVVIAPVPGKMVHTFHRKTGVMWEIHTAIRQDCGIPGKEKVRLTREACTIMIRQKGARKFITHVPEGNRAAAIYAVACGLERVGVLTRALKRNGQLLDMTLYQSRDEDILKILEGK